MNCPARSNESHELLIDYCADALPLGTRTELERHIEKCPDCSDFVRAQQQVWTALDGWKTEPISADFDCRLYASIAEAERPSWRQWLAGRIGWQPAVSLGAACAALAVALLVNAPSDRPRTQQPSVPPVSAMEDARADAVEPEQLERALEDLEMLKQLSPSATQSL